MIPFAEAQQRLMARAHLLAAIERVALNDALHRVLAEDVVSRIDVPPADNSAVDGYAIATAGLESFSLPVSQRIAAGDVPDKLQVGTTARIFTGATVPEGADAVVMQEDCSESAEGQVLLPERKIAYAENIRRRGQDIEAGSVVVARGEKLMPWHIGLLASVGVDDVSVYRPLRIAVLSTGDELQEPGEAPLPGKIFNSNRYQILALIRACGFVAIDGGYVADSFEATRNALMERATNVDMIVTSGGVSVGEEDHVRAAVDSVGHIDLWKIAIKPGKPFAFGRVGESLFAGLPGNPSAVLVTFLILLKPFLDICQGRSTSVLLAQKIAASFSLTPGKRQQYLRVRVIDAEGDARLEKHPNQSSGMLSSACWSDGLAVIPAGESVTEGEALSFYSFESLLK